jgi:hypothetical protein
VVTSSLPQATVGKLYHQVVAVTSGTLPYTTFTVTGFSGGATGLTAAAITASPLTGAVVVNGTPTGAGSFAFTLNVMDAAGSALTRSYIVAVNLAPSLGSLTTTQWTVGKAGFTGVLAITGGTAPYALASATGTPTGMTVLVSGNNVFFSGAPTAAGSFAAGSVTIRDAAGATATRTFGIAINAPLAVSALSAAQWTLGQSGFGGTMKVTGGTGGLAIVAATGLPTGLSIGLTGSTLAFTGTPTAVHAFTGSVTLRDAVGAIVTRTFTITINAAPTVGNLTLAQWTANKAGFTGALSITGGTGPFTITSAAGLPTGLSAVMNGNTIRFIGTPTVAGAFTSASITVRDATGAMVMKTFTITIHPPLKITTLSFPPTPMAVFYTTAAATSGGTGPIKFALTAGSLPPGMTLSSTGVISGATRGFGSFTFTLTATDAAGATFSKQYTLTVSRSF